MGSVREAAGYLVAGWPAALFVMAGLDPIGANLKWSTAQTVPYVSWSAKAGHPRLAVLQAAKSWVTAPSPVMTHRGQASAKPVKLAPVGLDPAIHAATVLRSMAGAVRQGQGLHCLTKAGMQEKPVQIGCLGLV